MGEKSVNRQAVARLVSSGGCVERCQRRSTLDATVTSHATATVEREVQHG
jgi:hypothetical protein